MDVMEAVHWRRYIRDYEKRSLDRPLIEEMLNAAVQAPSAHNSQPWPFVLVEDRQRLES